MLEAKTYSGPTPPTRLLIPQQALRRFQPATIDAVAGAISLHPNRIRALQLMYHHFPDLLWDVIPEYGWLDVMRYFLRCVEGEGWFGIDWNNLDDLYQWAMDDYPETEEEENDPNWEPSALHYMALALEQIPVKCFGFDDWGFNELDQDPPLLLLNCLLDPHGFDFAKNFGEFDLGERDPAGANWDHLNALDSTRLSPPLCWLPEMARYACAETGNPLMDHSSHFEKWQFSSWYSWDTDLDTLRQDWQKAQAMLKRVRQFIAWADTEAELEIIFDLVTGAQK